MKQAIIGVKKLRTDLAHITKAAMQGHRFLVMKHNNIAFYIEPPNDNNREEIQAKKYTLEDLEDIQWSNPAEDRHLNKKIDTIMYGV